MKRPLANVYLSVFFLAALFWALPALAGMKALDDEDLDKITAGGDPVVVISEGGTASAEDNSAFQLKLPAGAQEGLRALTVQNVVGEVQLLVNLNVLAATADVAGTDQRNFSVQSWGSTLPIADTVKTVDGVAAAPCSGSSCTSAGGAASDFSSFTGQGGNAASSQGGDGAESGQANADLDTALFPALPQLTTIRDVEVELEAETGDGGNGGNAAAAAGGAGGTVTSTAGSGGDVTLTDSGADAEPGVISPAASASADTIVSGDKEAKFENNSAFNLELDPGAQTEMGSLFIANIVGRAQTAFNINIAAATLNLFPTPGTGTPFATPVGSTSAVIKQTNSGVQFRGTPIGVGVGTSSTIGITVDHTP